MRASNSELSCLFNVKGRLREKRGLCSTTRGKPIKSLRQVSNVIPILKNGPTEEQSNSTACSLSQVLISDKVQDTTQEHRLSFCGGY